MKPLGIFLAATAAVLATVGLAAQAQDFPSRTIRIVVARPPGGASDQIARAVAAGLTEKWGQPVVVDNQPGANGVIASGIVARAAKDGYTWLLADDAHPVNPHLQASIPYDSFKDFVPISLLASQSMLMVVNPSIPARTLQEFVALAKAAPGKYTYASMGVGSAQHLVALGIANAAGIDMLHVPFKSGSILGVIQGDVSVVVPSLSSVLPQVEAGKLRPLAITSSKRANALPDVPTVRESGIPFEYFAWEGIIVPAGTPAPVVAKIQAALIDVVNSSAVQKQLGDKMTLIGSTQDEFARLIAADYARWGKALKESGTLPN